VEPDIRDGVVDFVREWSEKAEIRQGDLVKWIGVTKSKFFDWQHRHGQVNGHNGWVPRDHWLIPPERDAILRYYWDHPLEGYRRLTYMMLDADVVAVSPATVYRILAQAGVLGNRSAKPSRKGTGFVQPLTPHEHWHVDIAYINLGGTFYYLCTILDGYSRYVVHAELREQMKETDVEVIIQRARESFPGVTPRIITDNGPQFVAKDFKEFIRLAGMTHVRTSPFYPQSNGKIERWHHSLKAEKVRLVDLQTYAQAQIAIADYIRHYNDVRLNSAIGYIAPADKLAGRDRDIFAERDRKLDAARTARAQARRGAAA